MKNELDYLPLSPRDDLDNLEETKVNYKHYEQKFLWALDNRKESNIKNIAITGYYGAGKSSVLKTFIRRNKGRRQNPEDYFKFLELSLATFHDENSEKITQDIEGTILQQIFYKVKDEEIPASKFSKLRDQKDNIWPINNWWTCVIFLLLIASFTFKIFEYFNFIYNLKQVVSNIASVILFLTFLILIPYVLIEFQKIRVKKFSFKNIDVELSKFDTELSVLNKFLNELIYFFRKTKYNIVVFEDIDRFDSAEIFSNLRELNFNLNNSDLIKEHIVFIYAIKNEQFKTAQDRTKFFDFIIPIIPIVNYETSVSLFRKQLNIDLDSTGEVLINDLFYFIDDMRIINNIINELKTYNTILGEESNGKNVSANKLIALIIYKNTEPNDFSKLLKNQGILYNCIEGKSKLIKEKSKEIAEEIKGLRKVVQIINSEESESLEELRKPYINLLYYKVKSQHRNIKTIENPVNQESFNLEIFPEKLKNNEIFNCFKNNQQVKYLYQGAKKNLNLDFKEVEKEVSFKNYEEREKLVSRKSEVQEKNVQIKKLLRGQSNLSTSKFGDLISEEWLKKQYEVYYGGGESKKEVQDIPKINFYLLYRILYNEYIDKDYFLYLSDFKELGFKKEDFLFIVRVKNNEPIEFDYKLQNKALVFSKLNGPDFKSTAIFNIDLIEYIFLTEEQNTTQVHILKQFEDNVSDRPLEFFEYYSKTAQASESYQRFISLIFKVVSTIWNEVTDTETIDEYTKTNIYQDIIKYASTKDLNQIGKQSFLRERIMKDLNFIKITDEKKTTALIKYLDLKLNLINFTGAKKVLDFIYENNRYTLRIENIRGFFNHISEDEEMEEECRRPLSLISNQEKLVQMNDYIFENITEYVRNCIIGSGSPFEEDESILLKLIKLSEEKLNIGYKTDILRNNLTKIKRLSEIKEFDHQLIVYDENKISPSWENLATLYKNDESILKKTILVDEVIEFLNIEENAKSLAEDISTIEETGFNKKLIEKIILSQKIEDECYRILVERIPYPNKNFNAINKLSDSKREILIKSKHLTLSPEDISAFLSKDRYKDVVLLLEVNRSEIEKKINNIISEFDNMLFKLILKSSTLTYNDLSCIINTYSNISGDSEVKLAIAKLLLKKPQLAVNKNVKKHLINAEVEESHIAKLFNSISQDFSKNEIREFFEGRHDDFSKLAQCDKRPKLQKYEGVEKMLKRLESDGIISGFKKEGDFFRVNHVYKY